MGGDTQSRRIALPALFAALALGIPGCSAHPDRPNIVLITIDTLRADHVSIYGDRKAKTPHLDALGREGVVFESAYCDVTWTTPSMASTLTGTLAHRHGLRSGLDRLSAEATTVAETLKTIGYQTAAVVGSYPLSSFFGLDQGFDVYDDAFTRPLGLGTEKRAGTPKRDLDPARARRSDAEVTEAAIRVLREFLRKSKPFFLWVHYFGPHLVPDPRLSVFQHRERHVATYATKVSRTDRKVGQLLRALDSLGIARDALVVLHSDHGESLGEHDHVGHGRYLYQDNLRVPLLMRWPGRIPSETRFSPAVANVDIAATILDAAEAGPRSASEMDGVSLLWAIEKQQAIHESLYLESYFSAHPFFAEWAERGDAPRIAVGVRRRGILRGAWKYIETSPVPLFNHDGPPPPEEIANRFARRELYDLRTDPDESRPLENGPEAERVSRELRALLDEYTSAGDEREGAPPAIIPADHLERLRSLGYVE